jgi:hypothetical protein
MADYRKRLAQVKPAAGVLDSSAVVPANKGWGVTSIDVNNTAGTDDGYAMEHRKSGEADADSHYFAGSTTRYHTIRADSMWGFTLGPTAQAGDILSFRSQSGNVTFTVWGNEFDQT